jgi:hypothetical protein
MNKDFERIVASLDGDNVKIETIGNIELATYERSNTIKPAYGILVFKGMKKKPESWRISYSKEYVLREKEYYTTIGENFKKVQSFKELGHPYKVGNIVYNSWGYDQTNIDFYQVVGVTAKTIKIRQLKQRTVETGFMSGDTEPIKDSFVSDEVLTKKPYCYGVDQWGIGFEYGAGGLLKHETMSCSWYA